MSAEDFFPDSVLASICRDTGGVLVEYRGQECHFHEETPTADVLVEAGIEARGIARMLIGPTGAFPNLEQNTLITVDGNDWVVGEWRHPMDGGAIYIFLKRNSTRQ